MSLGHLSWAARLASNDSIARQTARLGVRATSGQRWFGSAKLASRRRTEKVSAPGADHQAFLPRPRPAVWRSARTRSVVRSEGEAAVAIAAARVLVESISSW